MLGHLQTTDITPEEGARSDRGPAAGLHTLRKESSSSPEEMNNDYLALQLVANWAISASLWKTQTSESVDVTKTVLCLEAIRLNNSEARRETERE
jgi:hypothetical protein